MKTFLLSSLTIFSVVASYSQPTAQNSLKKNLSITKQTSFKPTLDADWLSTAQSNIAEREYFFKKGNKLSKETFWASNRQQKLGYIINASGYSVSPVLLTDKISNNWKEQINLTSIRRGGNETLLSEAPVVEEGKTKMTYRYNGFSIEYINGAPGLRQNFIIDHNYSGKGHLKLVLGIKGNLFPNVKNNQLEFENREGLALLYYRDLKVWDADHKVLEASMALNSQNELVIDVDDENATYPITVDPISQVPEWTTSASGILPSLLGQSAVDAAYGFSVAGLGDINGDGYDDVAIGAPAMTDLISGTGTLASVGAVFVYYGRPGGLGTTPDAILQPTTCVAGALFGYSIAGGDINGDGKNDIIVGAPMDKVTISIGGGKTASGNVGKVYAFDGATLSTNQSPFLTLQLSGNGILENVNLSVNALFGFSVAVTEDMNGDGKKDIIVGAPAYAGIKAGLLGAKLLDVQSGGAFVFLSNSSDNNKTLVSLNPPKSDILGIGLLQANINGLLFGYSVDGLGDYNGDGKPDVIASAPAGIDLSSVNALLNGKLLQGSALVYYGTGSGVSANSGATLVAASGGLLTNLTGSLANVANLFGTSVKGVRNAAGIRNGNVLVGAPLGGAITNILSLQLKTGTVNIFKNQITSPSGDVSPDQVLSSPRNTNNILQLVQCNLLFGYSLDNVLDVNCDGIGDIIVGEPASSGAQLLNANIAGGAAYVYLGKADGTYQDTPVWTMTANTDAFLGVNAVSLTGFSVAGAGYVKGITAGPRILEGSPSRTLDFSSGLLNLGNTFGTLFGLVAGDNGVGKADIFNPSQCELSTLPVSLTQLKASYINEAVHVTWGTVIENHTGVFEVEHSVDGVNFTGIGQVKAAGYSNTVENYEFDDAGASGGNNYYRLRIIDNDGSYTYSNTVMVKVPGSMHIISVYPSPFVDKVNVDITAEKTENIRVKIFDLEGRSVTVKNCLINQGMNKVTIEGLGSLPQGLYVLKIQSGTRTLSQKLLK